MTSDHGLLTPGTQRAAGLVDDSSLVAAMLRVEVAWLRALSAQGAVEPDEVRAVESAVADWQVDLDALAAATEAAGNPVVPLVRALRDRVGSADLAQVVHRGLTSQDVLDTSLMLLARDALARTRDELTSSTEALAELAEQHRGTLMVGRTLTQHAVPVTFGLKAAQWLAGVLDAREQVDAVLGRLPVQCGGAAGTLSLVGEFVSDPLAVARGFADELSLHWPGVPWHTNRSAVARVGDALVGACDALGVIATDVALLSRPEVAEVREGSVAGRGGSSTMPHKRNPVLSVLVRSAALQAPLLAAQIHTAAAQAVDERPDGAWHSEWPALQRLLEVTVTAASQTAELVAGLDVDAATMGRRANHAVDDLLAERGRLGDPATGPADYLGSAAAFVDAVLGRLADAPNPGPEEKP